MSSITLPRRLAARLGPTWTTRLSNPGWAVLPLRAFLGVTFCYAGLQKLANPSYLDPNSPSSVLAQMRALRSQSPIGPLLTLSAHAPTLVALLIAVGELAVGVGALLGLLTRLAAVGGLLLALSFFLTVSWNTTPYYYGPDIVFIFAWTVLLAIGSGGVLSLETWLRDRARARSGLGREPAVVSVSAEKLRTLCPRDAKCGLGADGACSRARGCPVFSSAERLPAVQRAELDRRSMLASGVGVAGAGVATVLLAGTTAAVGRLVRNDKGTPAAAPKRPVSGGTGSGPATGTTPAGSSAPTGTVIAQASTIAVGHAQSFTDPTSNSPAWLVHTSNATFAAFSAICTHAGCTVDYDSSTKSFICPCHGGTFDAATGKVLQGPPPAPLPGIAVQVVNGAVSAG